MNGVMVVDRIRPSRSLRVLGLALCVISTSACLPDDDEPADGGSVPQADAAGVVDGSAALDASPLFPDAASDAGLTEPDASASDPDASPPDADAPDAGAADLGVHPDAALPDALPIDVGPRTWVTAQVGDTDSDFGIVVRATGQGVHVAHIIEQGDLAYTSATGGTWRNSNVFVEREPLCGSGCYFYPSMAIDGSERAHIAYRGLPLLAPYQVGTGSLIRYRIVDGSTVSAAVDIETIPEPSWDLAQQFESTPGMALASDGTAHIVYRSSSEPVASLRYATVSAGVASTPVTIPNSSAAAMPSYRISNGALVPGIDANGTLTVLLEPAMPNASVAALRRAGGTWQAPLALTGLRSPVITAAVGGDGVVHVIATSTDAAELAYRRISPAGVVSSGPPIPITACGPVAFGRSVAGSLAVDPGHQPAIVCAGVVGAYENRPIYFMRLASGAWSQPELISWPMAMPWAEGLTPALAFDPAGDPHVVFQSFAGMLSGDLLYATYQ